MSNLEIRADILEDILESFRKIFTEVILEFSDNDILIMTRNQSHSAYMKARIDVSSLQNYSLSECKQLVFDLTKLREFLNVYSGDSIELTITKDAIYVGKEKNFLFYVFSEEGLFKIPEINVVYRCAPERGDLLQVFKKLSVFSNFFKLNASRDDLTFSGEDKITGQGKVVLKIPEIDEEFEGIFLLHPLLHILDDAKIENKIDFKIFENNVIGFSFRKHEIDFEIYVTEYTGKESIDG